MSYLRQCQNKKEGGFSGAPYLQSHIASTYAAMLAVVNIGTEEAFAMVDVEGMRRLLVSVKNNNSYISEDTGNIWLQKGKDGVDIATKRTSDVVATLPGSIEIHHNGEMDMRGVYCSLVCADILDLIDDTPELTSNTADFISSC